jgi:endonuclease YncB( thermonuclease family)
MNHRTACLLLSMTAAAAGATAQTAPANPTTAPTGTRPTPRPQPRPSMKRVAVPVDAVSIDDGDTVNIRWSADDVEIVRILGIDTPETRHVAHDIPYSQPFGSEARAFARGVFAATEKIELLRAATIDPYGRTLGYVFVDGKNFSVLIVKGRLAEESVTRYGDNGFPAEAAEVTAAAKAAGPLPFEPPGLYRARMRDVMRALRERGEAPEE